MQTQRDYIVKHFLLALLKQVEDEKINLSEYIDAARFINNHVYKKDYQNLDEIETAARIVTKEFPELKKVLKQRIQELNLVTLSN